MKAQDIKPGMVLKLKKDRQDAYGLSCPFVRVTWLRSPNAYKTPYVYTGKLNDAGTPEAFRPSDFSRPASLEELL